MRTILGLALPLVCWLAGSPGLAADAPAEGNLPAAAVDRLVGLCHAWGHVEVFHPALAGRPDLDWDSAFVAAAPRALAAASRDDYSRAVAGMLAVLGDPATRLIHEEVAADGEAAVEAQALGFELTADGVLVLWVGDYYALGSAESQETLAAVLERLPTARALILDLRSPGPTDAYAQFLLDGALGPLERLLSPAAWSTTGRRRRVHYGFASSTPFASGQYRSGFLTEPGRAVVPAAEARSLPVVFLVDERSRLLPSMVPLQMAGAARVVVAGDALPAAPETTERIALADGLAAQVRVAEAVDAQGRSAELAADLTLPASPGDRAHAREAAIALAGSFAPAPRPGALAPAPLAARPPVRYPRVAYPQLSERLLAACRIHTVIERFYPYMDLLDDGWDEVLREHLPRFAAAQDGLAYALAVAGMVTHLHDSHAYVSGEVFNRDVLGEMHPPVRVRMVEDRPVVTAFFDEAAARAAGVAIGDVVLAVDGEEAAGRLARTVSYLSASTPQSLLDKAALDFLNGPEGSVVTLRLAGAEGEKTVRLERRYRFAYNRERAGEAVRILAGNIGYADLDRLGVDEVDAMFERFHGTQGIVFDMRGYPLGTAWAIAPRLTSGRDEVPAALFGTPLVGHPAPAPSRQTFLQTIPPAPPGAWTYTAPTVLLIDERTQSQAEHTGLFLKAANGTTFVGSPTAGANGEITVFSVPGGITIGFTGQSVEHPDGRQLQRVGLLPDVPARPTIAGLRAGRDEVLEAALAYLRTPSPN